MVAGAGLMAGSAAPANQAYLPRTGPANLRFALARPAAPRPVLPPLSLESIAGAARTNEVVVSAPPPSLVSAEVLVSTDLWLQFWDEFHEAGQETSVGPLVSVPAEPEMGAGTLTPQMLVPFFRRIPGQSNVIELPLAVPAPAFLPPAAATAESTATYLCR